MQGERSRWKTLAGACAEDFCITIVLLPDLDPGPGTMTQPGWWLLSDDAEQEASCGHLLLSRNMCLLALYNMDLGGTN